MPFGYSSVEEQRMEPAKIKRSIKLKNNKHFLFQKSFSKSPFVILLNNWKKAKRQRFLDIGKSFDSELMKRIPRTRMPLNSVWRIALTWPLPGVNQCISRYRKI